MLTPNQTLNFFLYHSITCYLAKRYPCVLIHFELLVRSIRRESLPEITLISVKSLITKSRMEYRGRIKERKLQALQVLHPQCTWPRPAYWLPQLPSSLLCNYFAMIYKPSPSSPRLSAIRPASSAILPLDRLYHRQSWRQYSTRFRQPSWLFSKHKSINCSPFLHNF